MLGKEFVSSFEMVEKTPVGFLEYDQDAEEVAVHLAERGHELSFFRTLEDYELSPDYQVIKVLTSSQEVYQHLVATNHGAFYIQKDCCAKRTAALISEECLEEDSSKATYFYLDV